VFYTKPARCYYYYRYDSYFAHSNAKNRKYVRPNKLDQDKELRSYLLKKLKTGWSPQQIEGRLKLKRQFEEIVTHETIYRYIYGDFNLKHYFYKYFRRKHVDRIRRCMRRKRFIPESLLIRNRPSNILTRKSFGHWECDLMIFRKGVRSNLITLRERKSRYLIAVKNSSKKANETATNIIKQLSKYASKVKSITFDQGSEFFKYSWIAKSIGADIYFCDPGSPHQKGSVENVNGVIRTQLPRSLDIGLISQRQVDTLVNEINNRPMKCHNYQTSKEIFMRNYKLQTI